MSSAQTTKAAPALLAEAKAALRAQDFARVIALTDDLVSRMPDNAEVLAVRYAAQGERGELKAAVETLRKLLDLQPDAIHAVNDLSLYLMLLGERVEADTVARHALRLAPLDPQAHNMMGMLLSDGNDLRSGEWHYRRALELSPPQAKLYANLGLNLLQQGRFEESGEAYRKAVEMEPDNPATLVNWARLCEARGDTARAHALIDTAEKLAKASGGDVGLARALVLSREKRHKEAIEALDQARKSGKETALPPLKQLERGRLYDRLGRFDEAWADFIEAKGRFAEIPSLKYDRPNVDRFFKRLGYFFTSNHMGLLPRAKRRADAPTPIFILGFPRSGTTMIEQVLSSHSQATAGDELTFVSELVRLAPRILSSPYDFPEALADLWMGDRRVAIETFRDYYLSRADQMGLVGGKPYFTDKMPLNETFLPFLHLMFPEAKFVHLIRHPLDIGVSVMSNYLTHGFNCGFRLDDFAHHYMAVFGLVTHYRKQAEFPYYQLRYETFVRNQREETEELLAFLGLPFEERCILFHENERYARTASYAQVTERLHDRSLGRYRNYLHHLEPVIPTLRPALDALGYAV